MTSIYEDSSTWRLRFPSSWSGGNGIPARLVSRDGSFDKDVMTVTEVYLMEAIQLFTFAKETFPPPYFAGEHLYLPQPRRIPGQFLNENNAEYDSGVYASQIRWKEHIPGLPVDPLQADDLAPVGTYKRIVEVTVEYTSDPNNDDFWHFSSHASGEVIFIPNTKGVFSQTGSASDEEPNKDPTAGAHKLIPMTEWTADLPRMPRQYFEQTYLPLMRTLIGKTNSVELAYMHGGLAETMLFVGFSMEESLGQRWAWPLMTKVQLKFLEKLVTDGSSDGVTKGHNHFWNPNVGKWQRLLFGDDKHPAYELANLNQLFNPFQDAAPSEPMVPSIPGEIFEFTGPPSPVADVL